MENSGAITTVTYSPDRRLINITIETKEAFTWKYISDNLKSLSTQLEQESDNELQTMPQQIQPGNDQKPTEPTNSNTTPVFTEWYDKGNGAV